MKMPLSDLKAGREKIAQQRAMNRATLETLEAELHEAAEARDEVAKKVTADDDTIADYDKLIAQLEPPQAAEVDSAEPAAARLQVALPIGFTHWLGGASPFGVFTKVDVIFADGQTNRIFGRDMPESWKGEPGAVKIVGYREVTSAVEAAERAAE